MWHLFFQVIFKPTWVQLIIYRVKTNKEKSKYIVFHMRYFKHKVRKKRKYINHNPLKLISVENIATTWFSFAFGYLLACHHPSSCQSGFHPLDLLSSHPSPVCWWHSCCNHILWLKIALWTQSWLLHPPVLRNASSTTEILKLDWPGLSWWFTKCLRIWESSFLLEKSSQWLLAHSQRLLSVSPT